MDSEKTEQGPNRAEIHVESLVTGDDAGFRMDLDATLQQTWDEGYRELDEVRRDGDTFQCAGAAEGQNLMDELNLTLRQVRERRICGDAHGSDRGVDFSFEIKGPSGGA